MFTAASLGIDFKCEELIIKEGHLEVTPKFHIGSLEFKKCTNIEPVKCKLPMGAEVKTKPIVITSLKELGANEVEGVSAPETGNAWASITLEGATCAVAGMNTIKGKAKILLPHGQTQSIQQEVRLNTGAGELEVGSSAMTLAGIAVIEPEAKEKWSFD